MMNSSLTAAVSDPKSSCVFFKLLSNYSAGEQMCSRLLVGLFAVCLLTALLKTFWMNVHKLSGKDSLWDKQQIITFWGDLHSDLDPGILFLLQLFAMCQTALLYCCSLGVTVSTIMSTI